MARFQTKIRRARFVVVGYSPEQMLVPGNALRDSIEQRILRAEDAYDAPAKPLSSKGKYGGYAAWKAKKAPPAERNWKFRGRTLRSMKVLAVAANRAVIGFTDPESNRVAYYNNRRVRQFGVSPRNRQAVALAFASLRNPIQVRQVA